MKSFSIPISVKIFSISGSMLAILLTVAYVNYRNISRVNQELSDLANYLTKLTENVAIMNVHSLEQEIHYERAVRILETEPVDESALAKELEEFEERGELVDKELKIAVNLAHGAIKDAQEVKDQIEFARIEPLLEILEQDHQEFHDRGIEVINLLKAGDRDAARLLDKQLEHFEDTFESRIRGILFELGEFTAVAARSAQEHENEALAFSWILAAIATGVGLTFASVVTLGLVRPIKRLVEGTQKIEDGELGIAVPITTRDEVGQLSTAFNQLATDIQEKEHIKSTFGQYVDPRIVETLIQNPGDEAIARQEEMTVFFSDMAGFSTISEMLTPAGLVSLIDRYLTFASEPINANRGVIDKFIGDAVTAFWGPPFVGETEHAKLACYAALEQLSQLTKLRRLLPEIMGIRKGLPDIRIRVGLATGDLVAGNIGSETLKSYTVMGPAVQIAEYLEGASKSYGTTILMTDTTKQAAGDGIATREIDRIILPGQTQPTPIHELLDIVGNLSVQQESLRRHFTDGLSAYYDRNWDSAEQSFTEGAAIAPEDQPTQLYLQRIAHYRQNPPATSWDGVWA
ncbi:MAG: adenylate/guanylate cyclase domain-containing protein [Cyanobacteria bacterium P01_C01_bin.89]